MRAGRDGEGEGGVDNSGKYKIVCIGYITKCSGGGRSQ